MTENDIRDILNGLNNKIYRYILKVDIRDLNITISIIKVHIRYSKVVIATQRNTYMSEYKTMDDLYDYKWSYQFNQKHSSDLGRALHNVLLMCLRTEMNIKDEL